jgi:ferric-dicitrate binding protein FerR (iron transport regulator)
MENEISPQDRFRDGTDAFYYQKWQEASAMGVSPEVQERMLRRIRRRMNMRGFNPGRWMQYAAVVVACVSLAAASWFYMRSRGQAPAAGSLVIAAEKGQRTNVVLPDGTRVWLNSHSQITYPADYGLRERALALTGEAYFEVAKDSTKRFLVKAGEMEVEALGTSFNIKAYEEDPEIVATLFAGSIQTTAGDKKLKLLPEQYASFAKNSRLLLVRHSENVAYASGWRDNELTFDCLTMGEIAVLFNRMYNVEIVFKSEKIKNYRFSGVIKNNSLDNVIEIISLTAPIVYESMGDTIVLSEKKRQ